MNFKNKRNFFIGLLIIVLIAISCYGWQYYHSPEYSLAQAYLAMKNHDVENFQKYVAVDSVCNSIIDGFTDNAIGIINKDNNNPLGDLARGFVALAKPVIAPGLKSGIIQYVKTGNWSHESASTNSIIKPENKGLPDINKLSLETILPDKNQNPLIEYRQISSVKKDGNHVIVSLRLFSTQNQREFTIRFIMIDQGMYWQLIGFDRINETLAEYNGNQ